MIEEIKRRLDAGEVVELECVDRGGFLKDIRRREANEKIIDQGPLVVGCIDHDGDIMLAGGDWRYYRNVIVSGEFKYFRIKESSATFNDLIDVAIQAYKDGVIKSLKLLDYGVHSLSYSVAPDIDENTIFSQHKDYSDGINSINSLYTETFVIESQSDLSMIKLNDKKTKVKLTNGELVNDEFWDNLKNMTGKTQFLLLKGATVTQKRGNQ